MYVSPMLLLGPSSLLGVRSLVSSTMFTMLRILHFFLTLALDLLLTPVLVVHAGPIPSTLGGLVCLVGLNLRSNQLTGKCVVQFPLLTALAFDFGTIAVFDTSMP